MRILGKPDGLFDLNDSDKFVGSFLSRQDIKEVLKVNDLDLAGIKFRTFENVEVVDERTIQKLWYDNKIPNVIAVDKSSLDELILIAIIKRTFPKIEIERQFKIGRFALDLKLTLGNKELFVEFDGPSHFTFTRYGFPKPPFRKKEMVEQKTGVEVVNWGYWIQRCSTNVKALFDKTVLGYGVLWSTDIHFGMFAFENSAQIIETITKRFNAVDSLGYGYFYEGKTRGRNNPAHPIISKILEGSEVVEKIIPKGFSDRNYWLPERLSSK